MQKKFNKRRGTLSGKYGISKQTALVFFPSGKQTHKKLNLCAMDS